MNADAPELEFAVEGAEAVKNAAVPQLALQLRITCVNKQPIHSVLLRCQVHIDAPRRRYTTVEQAKLYDLFGEPADWGRTLRGMHWTNVNVSVPGFVGDTSVDVPISCSYDFNLAAVKYFDALADGEAPLTLLFNGTVFYSASGGLLQVAQIPWEKQAQYLLPVRLWRTLMEHYYPNSAWLHLRKDVFDRLLDYKRRNALPTWELTIEELLATEPATAMQ